MGAKLCGKTKEEAIGTPCYKFLKGLDAPCEICHMDFASDQEYTEMEYSSPASSKHFMSRFKFINWDGRRALVEYLTDETTRINAQIEAKNLYEHELALRKKIMSDAIIYYQINLTTGIIEEYHSKYNDVPDMEPGKQTSQFVKKEMLDNIADEYKDAVSNTIFASALKKAYERGETSVSLDYRRKVVNGDIHWVKAMATIMERPSDGNIIAFLHNQDIDVEMKNKLALDSIVEKEIESLAILNVKSGMARLVRVTDELRDEHTDEIFDYQKRIDYMVETDVVEEDRQMCREFFTMDNLVNRLESKPLALTAYRIKTDEGELIRKRARAYYLDDTHEDIILSRRDITSVYAEEQRQKQMLEEAVAEATRASNAKTEFLSRMSHDMRTPLNAVIGMVELAKDEENNPRTEEYLESINISSHFLLGLINDILDLSKIESDMIELHEEPFGLEEFTRGINTVIKPLMDQKGIDFVFDMGCGASLILADKLRFEQIFFNLLSNAVKYTPEGGRVEFFAEHIDDAKDGRRGMRFHVKDSGCGMSKEFQKSLFTPFVQERRTHESERQGSGLGLAIVKNLIDVMGGSISVKSAPGEGTEFTVDLYAYMLEHEKEVETAEQENVYDSLKGLKVLLVDDNEINIVVASKLLNKKGCIVRVAENGLKAVEMFASSKPGYFDIILMDLRMPVLDGLEATRRIREMNRDDAASIPIIAMTADAFADDRNKTKEAGMNDHVAKPIETTTLYDIISKYICK